MGDVMTLGGTATFKFVEIGGVCGTGGVDF